MRLAAAVALALSLCAGRAGAVNFTLTVSTFGPVSPSVITSTPSGIICPSTCSASFVAGSTVTLGVVAASTVNFAGWTGANGCQTNQQSCNVLVAAAAGVSATFMPILQVSMSGNGLGTVADSTGLINCSSINGCIGAGAQRYSFPKGTRIVLTETAGSSSTFVGWSGDSGCAHASTCTITLNGYESIVSTFAFSGTSVTIAVGVIGHGTVTSSPSGVNCVNGSGTCAVAFSTGTHITLSTAAASGWHFSGWSNGGCASSSTACVVIASSTYQGLGGYQSPAAFFYKTP